MWEKLAWRKVLRRPSYKQALFIIATSFLYLAALAFLKNVKVEGELVAIVAKYSYVGGFVLSFAGCFSVFVGLPYTTIFLVAPLLKVDLVTFSIISGLGASLGETSSYLLGMAGMKMGVKEMLPLRAIVEKYRGWTFFLIFLFAYTPLPDDLLMVALGLIRYSIWKTLLFAFAGKTLMALSLSIFGSQLTGLFAYGSLGGIALLVIFLIIFIVMFSIDWEQLVHLSSPDSFD